jgi:hypothetical protein
LICDRHALAAWSPLRHRVLRVVTWLALASVWTGVSERSALAEDALPDDVAQEPETGDEPLPPQAPEGTRVKVAAFIFPALEIDANVATEVMAGLRRGLREDARLEYVDPSDALEASRVEEGTEPPSTRGAQLLETAASRASQGHWTHVVKLLDEAIELFESDLTNARRTDLVDASLLWGVAQCKLRRAKVCQSAFRRVVTFRESVEYDTAVLPADVAPMFQEVRDETLAGPRGSIRIESEPPGAEVFVDGRFIGAAPTRAEGLLAGDHYVTLQLAGYERSVHRVVVQTDFEDTVTFELLELDNAALLRDALAAAREEMGAPRVGPGMRDLWSLLLVDQVILGEVRRVEDSDEFVATLYLYDLRTNHGLRRIENRLDWSSPDMTGAEQLAVEIYRDVDLSGRIQPREELPPPPPEEPVPFYRTWWFWTIAGAVVIGTTIGVASALAPQGESDGSGQLELSF